MGEFWEPGTGEKGLRGLVRLTELSGLAGLFVLKEPDAALTANKQHNKQRCLFILTGNFFLLGNPVVLLISP